MTNNSRKWYEKKRWMLPIFSMLPIAWWLVAIATPDNPPATHVIAPKPLNTPTVSPSPVVQPKASNPIALSPTPTAKASPPPVVITPSPVAQLEPSPTPIAATPSPSATPVEEEFDYEGYDYDGDPPYADNCDPSYPDLCLPLTSPDLDCDDVAQSEFTVLQPDPHRFDRDKDGVGCEG